MPLHQRVVHLVEITRRLVLLRDEIVPDVLDGDGHAGLLGHGKRLAEFGDGALPALLIRHAVAGHAGHDEDGGGAVAFGVADGLDDPFEPDLAHFRIRAAERLRPVEMTADAGGLEAGVLKGGDHFVLCHAAHQLHALKTGGLHGLEFFEHGTLHPDGGIHDGLADGARFGGLGGGRQAGFENAGRGEGGSGGEEMAAVHGGSVIGVSR